MKRTALSTLTCATILIGSNVCAEPIGLIDQDGGFLDLISTNITTGASVWPRTGTLRSDGTDIRSTDVLFNYHEYTTRQVQLANADEIEESYIEGTGLLGRLTSSSVADGAGNLEVGADGVGGASRAWSYFSLTVKNERSRPVNLDFAFDIPEGEVLTNDPARYPATDGRRAHATVQASIGALLRSPDDEYGGTWIETEHSLFDFRVDMLGSCAHNDSSCAGVVIDYTDNALPYLRTKDLIPGTSIFGLDIAAYSGLVSLPEIPAHGELTLFYNMYALGSGGVESAARAMLGDPFTLGGSGGIRLTEIIPNTPGGTTPVPLPATGLLFGMGLLAFGLLARSRHNAQPWNPQPELA